jgi:hypothetical protein
MTLRLLMTTMWLLPTAMAAAQQTSGPARSTTGTAGISGMVMSEGAAPVPIRRATVTLSDGATLLLIAVTDDRGEFGFPSLPAGRFTVSAAKGGYLPATYGARRPGGTGMPIALAAGQRATGITMKLLKGGVLTGLVVGEDGQPVPDAGVQAFKRMVSESTGEPTLQAAPFASSQVTDDRGRYRIWGLEPGEYAVSATSQTRSSATFRLSESPDIQRITDADVQRAQRLLSEAGGTRSGQAWSTGTAPPPASPVTYAPVYFPSAVDPADAVMVPIGPHEERDGVNIQLRMVPTAKVEGVVTGPNGAPMADVSITMLDPGPLPLGMLAVVYRDARSDRDGKYVLPSITPGTYNIAATARADGTPLWAAAQVVVAGRDVNVPIAMMPGLTISGRMVFEGASPPPRDLAALLPRFTTLRVGPSMSGLLPPTVAPDGTFSITLMGGKQRVGWMFARPPGPSAGWLLKSVVINGTSVEDVVFEVTQNIDGVVVTFTDQTTEISGTLQDAAGKPVPDYVLLAFSADKRFWLPQSRRTQLARPDANGQFVIRYLPAGDYLIAALPDVEPGQLSDAAFLSELAAQSPIRITLAEGEKKVQNIKVGGG